MAEFVMNHYQQLNADEILSVESQKDYSLRVLSAGSLESWESNEYRTLIEQYDEKLIELNRRLPQTSSKEICMFVMNKHGHFFEINTKEIVVSKEQFNECRFFDNEEALLREVCSKTGCSLEEVEGSTFYISMRNGQPVAIDDRCFVNEIEEPVEKFVSEFLL